MTFSYRIPLFIFVLSLLVSCTPCRFNTCSTSKQQVGRPESWDIVHSGQRYVVNEPLQIQQSITQVGNFNSQMIFLADQLERNLDKKVLTNTFIVTAFADLNRLNETSSLGRLVSEDLIHELQVRHWNIFDVRLTKDVIINEAGEFSLSRDISKIRDTYKVGGIVAGTYSVNRNHIIVNARVIDIETGIVSSAGQIHLPLNGHAEGLLYDSLNGRSTMKIVGDGK